MTEYDYSADIINALLNKGVITEELYEKCSKPHISSLPYDLRTTDLNKLEDIVRTTLGEIMKTSNNILRATEDISDEEYRRDNYDELCEADMGFARDNLKVLREEIDKYDGDHEDTIKFIQDVCGGYDNLMPKIFDMYEDYLKMDSSDRITQRIYSNESKLRSIANDLVSVGSVNSSFTYSHPIDNSSIIRSCDRLSQSTRDAISNHEMSIRSEQYINERNKERDSEYNKLNDYRNHLNSIDTKLDSMNNLSDEELNNRNMLKELIRQSNETFNIQTP